MEPNQTRIDQNVPLWTSGHGVLVVKDEEVWREKTVAEFLYKWEGIGSVSG
jgi:hypothetical protein